MTISLILSLIPIPAFILDILLAVIPLLISLFGSASQINDYITSGTLLRAAGFIQSCCDTFDFIVGKVNF